MVENLYLIEVWLPPFISFKTRKFLDRKSNIIKLPHLTAANGSITGTELWCTNMDDEDKDFVINGKTANVVFKKNFRNRMNDFI